jgi:hypothetical protein
MAMFMTYALLTALGIHPYVALIRVLPVFFVFSLVVPASMGASSRLY